MTWNLGPISGLLVAALCGGAVGLERQRSGHAIAADGTDLHFAGLRTFTLIGVLGGVAGWLWRAGYQAPAAVLLGGGTLLVAAAYVGASRRDVDGTTEVAALVVLAAGFLSGIGRSALASGLTAGTLLLLMEKTRLHAWVARVDDAEFRSGVRFAAMAAVVLPLLPEGPFGPAPGLRPRELWLVVLLITGLEFVGYVARRRIGDRYGYAVGGLLGGLISSTTVTLSYSRIARAEPALAPHLAAGALAANAALFPRVALTALVIDPALGRLLVVPLAIPLVVLAVSLGVLLRRRDPADGALPPPARNPMHVGPALQLAAIYQVAIYAIAFIREALGPGAMMASGFLLGIADIDALTISMARQHDPDHALFSRVVLVGVLGTTLFKAGVAQVVGRGLYRWRVVGALSAVAASIVLVLWGLGG